MLTSYSETRNAFEKQRNTFKKQKTVLRRSFGCASLKSLQSGSRSRILRIG